MRISDYIDADLLDRFEFYNYNHAIEIITQAFPKEWSDVVECLRKLDITTDDLREAGGNETKIPKKFDDVPIQVVLAPYLRIIGFQECEFLSKSYTVLNTSFSSCERVTIIPALTISQS